MAFQFVEDHRDYLKRELQARSQRRPLYSQRAFARDIGLSPSSLTDFLKGRMRLSPARVAQVGETIKLSSEQKQHWVDLIESKFSRSPEIKNLSQMRVRGRLQAQRHSMSVDDFKIIAEWFHMAFLELIDMDAVKYTDLKVAAAALAIPVKTLRVAVKRLEKTGFLEKNEDGVFQVSPSTQMGGQAPSEAIRQYHSQVLKKALAAMETMGMDRRINTSTIVALPKAEVEKILVDVRSLALNFLDPYVVRSQNTTKDSMYCLNVNFFDLLNSKGNTP